jgi:hypothetical protein
MPPSDSRQRSQPSGCPRALWILPILLLALVGFDGARADHHRPAVPGLRSARQAGFRSETATDAAQARSAAATPTLRVRLTRHGTLRPLPTSFLGLSTESWFVEALDSDPTALDRVLNMLRVPGNGGLSFRIGGESTDETYWDAPSLGAGMETYRPGKRWLTKLASLTRATHLRLLLDFNLVARSPSMAAAFAEATSRALPAGSIAAFEVGNEPDIGHRQVANPLTPEQKVPRSPVGWDEYSSSQYTSLFGSYRRAVRRVVPSARMAGPEIFFPGRDLSWLHKLLSADRSRLAMLTVHRYPLSSCASPAWHDYATIARVLGQSASGGLAHSLAGAVHVAQGAGVPVRLTELNSVTCGGRLGVSNTFATALWAPDTLFSMWKVGVSGVNLHIQPGNANAAFSVSSAGLVAHPLLYGMIMFARALGSGAELAPVRSSGATSSNVKVWAVRSSRHWLKVLVLNKGGGRVNAALDLGAHGAASVQRLSAPSAAATTGVSLDGQQLGPQGQWLGTRIIQHVSPSSRGTYTVAIPAYSGALVTLHL